MDVNPYKALIDQVLILIMLQVWAQCFMDANPYKALIYQALILIMLL